MHFLQLQIVHPELCIMIIVLSPAKIQNFAPQQLVSTYTQPRFLKEAEKLGITSEQLADMIQKGVKVQ